jgi:transcriptional regulator with PAS, ATPase and Fis domain
MDFVTNPRPDYDEAKPAARAVRRSPNSRNEADLFDGIVGASLAMREVVDRAKRVANSDASVLLRGESGTGKGVIAQLIHRCSPRRHMPMIIVNCAALPDTLLESELFGSKRGAFTGSTSDRSGFFEVADGGTIFLDEIGEVSASFQAKLLRVIETGEFNRLGDAKCLARVDVRIIAATNRDLEDAIDTGAFRADLYYRLNVVPIVMPTLRARMEDLPALIDYFIEKHGEERRFSDDALRVLMAYDWPGNVREVANAVEHALVLSGGSQMQTFDLPAAIQNSALLGSKASPSARDEDDTLESIEISSILQAVEKADYNRTRAAQLLGVTRRTLGYRIEKYGLADVLASRREFLAPRRTRVAQDRRPPARPHPQSNQLSSHCAG